MNNMIITEDRVRSHPVCPLCYHTKEGPWKADLVMNPTTRSWRIGRLGSYRMLGLTKPSEITAESICPVCGDMASKRKLRNSCACEIHRVYT